MTEPVSRQIEFFKKAKSGFISLSIRQVVTFCLQTVSVLVLARFLDPENYGLFGVLMGWVSTMIFFTDVGIGGALVHQIEAPSTQEIRSFMGLRILLASLMTLALWLVAPYVLNYYGLKNHEEYRWMSLILLAAVLSSGARVSLARDFSFKEMARADFFAGVSAYASQIVLATSGFGAWSLAIGAGSRHLVDAVASEFYAFRSKRIFLLPSFRLVSLRKYLNYGAFYQLNSLVTSSRAVLVPLVAGAFLEINQIGLIFWIAGLTGIPLLFAGAFNASFFPVLSRLRDNVEEARAGASAGLSRIILGFGFIYGLGAALGPWLIPILFNPRWHAASAFVPLEAAATGLNTIRFLGNTIMTAQGRPGQRVKLESVSIGFELSLIFAFGLKYGMDGYYYGLIIANFLTLIWTAWHCRLWLEPRVFHHFGTGLSAALLGFFSVRFFSEEIENLDLWTRPLAVTAIFIIIYGSATYLMFRFGPYKKPASLSDSV